MVHLEERIDALGSARYGARRNQLEQAELVCPAGRRQTAHGTGLGRHRWVVERTFAWLHNRRRLLLHTDRRHETHEAFLALACCLICWRRLETRESEVLSASGLD